MGRVEKPYSAQRSVIFNTNLIKNQINVFFHHILIRLGFISRNSDIKCIIFCNPRQCLNTIVLQHAIIP